jgi:hypothetical protein
MRYLAAMLKRDVAPRRQARSHSGRSSENGEEQQTLRQNLADEDEGNAEI